MYMGGIEMNPSIYDKRHLLGEYSPFLSSHQGKEFLCS